MRRVARREAVPAPFTTTSSVRSAERTRDSAVRAERVRRTTKLVVRPAAAFTRPLPIATLRPLVRIPSRRAVVALTIRRADIVHAVEHSPASFRPRLAIRDGLSDGRRVIAFESAAVPAAAWSVAVAPSLRRSARRAARLSLTPTAPAPERFEPPPSRTVRPPRRGRPRRAAILDETTSALVRRQSPSQLLSTLSLPALASTSDSSVERTAKAGGGEPATLNVTGALDPTLPAASL